MLLVDELRKCTFNYTARRPKERLAIPYLANYLHGKQIGLSAFYHSPHVLIHVPPIRSMANSLTVRMIKASEARAPPSGGAYNRTHKAFPREKA